MQNTLAQNAISLALSGKWQEALEINLEILTKAPEDTEALNRTARCYAELGDSKKAIETSQKVLSLDPVNSIAQKCLLKWKSGKPADSHQSGAMGAEAFLEESGKTRLVMLMNTGDSTFLSSLNSGDDVKIVPSPHKVSVTDMAGKYVGCLPDDLSARLRNLLKNGCKYQVLVKSIDSHGVSVFIRELENKTGVASFPTEKIDYVTFTPPELVHKDVPEMSTTEEIAE